MWKTVGASRCCASSKNCGVSHRRHGFRNTMGAVASVRIGFAVVEDLQYSMSVELNGRKCEVGCWGQGMNAHRSRAAPLTVHPAA